MSKTIGTGPGGSADALDYTPEGREWNNVTMAPAGTFPIAAGKSGDDFVIGAIAKGTSKWPTGASIKLVNSSAVTVLTFTASGEQHLALASDHYHWVFSGHVFAGLALYIHEA